MTTTIWLAIGLLLLVFLGYRAGRVWLDTGQRNLSPARRVGWALAGAVWPDRYWWEARIEAMTVREREELLAWETRDLGLSRADSLRCPLCSSEVPRAWALEADGERLGLHEQEVADDEPGVLVDGVRRAGFPTPSRKLELPSWEELAAG